MKHLVSLLFLLLALTVSAQENDFQLAYKYYQNKEYGKAAEMFIQLYQRTHSSSYLDYHIICLINGKEYDKAESVLKKYLKINDNNKDFLINLGFVYAQQGKLKKSEEYYAKAVGKLIPQTGDIHSLANKFRNIREYGWANKTYLKGRELLKKPTAFLLEMGDNYMMDRDYDNMCTVFLELLKTDPGKLNSITSTLGFARSYDVNENADGAIRNSLEKIFATREYAPVFDELGVWYALQTGDYPAAFDHAVKLNTKAVDKLYIYLNIAREALSAQKYEIARNAYLKIIDKGKTDNSFYYPARKELLRCRYEQYCHSQTASSEYKELAESCKNFLQETGYTGSNSDVLILLSDLYAYSLNLPDSADTILQRGIQIRRLDAPTLNLLKSKRADLLAYMNNPWEATILYTQIEKANPNNDNGYEAKLKKAQLAYYEGDLLWAKAQFDAIKGSTTKFISNDAIKMSHFINTHYEEDGDNSDLEYLACTEYKVYKKQYPQALPRLDSLIQHSPAGIADYASLVKAEVLLSCFKIEEAETLLKNLRDKSDQTYVRAEALYKLAELKAHHQQKQEALDLYKILVSDYSGSVYSVEAGKKYRELNGEIPLEK